VVPDVSKVRAFKSRQFKEKIAWLFFMVEGNHLPAA
jgi:hypothetical protein